MIYEKHTRCVCICDCGNEVTKTVEYLKGARNPSCGCLTSYYRSINNMTDETGQKFGRLTIVSIDRSHKPSLARCICECGNEVVVNKADVVCGHTLSCGCLQKEHTSLAVMEDHSGKVALSGVKFLSPAYMNNKVWMWNCLCPLCNNEFVALPAKVLSNHTTSCGCKIESSKVRMIESILKENGVKYEREKRFKECADKYTLPFDFAIYKDDDSLLCLIEYDGRQHSEPISFYGGEKAFTTRRAHDELKNRFCEDNNIVLHRLSYSMKDSEIKGKIINIIYP